MPYNHPPSSNSTVSPSQMNLNQYLLSNNLPYDPAFVNYQQQQAPESDASSVSSYRSSHSQHNAEDDNRSVESNENGAWRTAEADLSALNLGFEQATSSALGTDQTQQLNKPVVTLQFPSMDRKPVSVLINPVTENLNVPEGSTLRPADMNSFLTDISKFPLPLDLSPESFQFQQNDNGTVDVFASGHFFQTFEVAHPNTIERNTKLDLEGIYTDTSMSQNSNNQYYQTQNVDPSGLLPPTAGRPRSPSPARRHRRRSRSPLSGSVHPADPALLLPPGASKARGRRRSTSPTAGSRDVSPTGSASSNGSVNEDGKAKVTKSDKSAKKVYICNYPNCGQSFDRPYNLRNHELVHTGEKPHVCDLCNRGFSRLHDLKRHISTVHENIKPYNCVACQRNFARQDALRRHVTGEPNCYQYLASINQLPEGLSSTHSSSSSISSNGTPHIQPPPRTSSLNSRRSSSNSNAAAVSPTPAPILFDFTSHPALATQNILSPGLEMQNLHLNSQPSSPALPLSSNMNQTNAMGGAGLEYGNYFGIDPNMIQTPTNNIDMSLLMNMGINGGTNSADMMTLLSMANNGTPDTLSSDVINLDMSEIEKLFGEMNNQGLYPNPQQTATTNSSMSDLTLLNGAGSQGYASSDTLNQLSGNSGNLPLDTLEVTEEQLKMLLNEGYGGQLNGLGHGNVNGKGTTNGSVLGTSIGNNQV